MDRHPQPIAFDLFDGEFFPCGHEGPDFRNHLKRGIGLRDNGVARLQSAVSQERLYIIARDPPFHTDPRPFPLKFFDEQFCAGSHHRFGFAQHLERGVGDGKHGLPREDQLEWIRPPTRWGKIHQPSYPENHQQCVSRFHGEISFLEEREPFPKAGSNYNPREA